MDPIRAMGQPDATRAINDEEWLGEALTRFALERDPVLRDEIVVRANWLARRAAQRFADRGEPFDDLLQVARLGLLKAVDRFDPSHGVPFGAFATPTIMGELKRYFRDHTWSLHVPRRAKDMRPAVNAASDKLAAELGRSPRVAEISAELGISDDLVLEVLEANGAYRTHTLAAAVTANARQTDSSFDRILDREVVVHLLDQLPERERTILVLRFYEGLTQAQIATRIGTSQVHVGRLITSTLAMLQTHLRSGEGIDS